MVLPQKLGYLKKMGLWRSSIFGVVSLQDQKMDSFKGKKDLRIFILFFNEYFSSLENNNNNKFHVQKLNLISKDFFLNYQDLKMDSLKKN